MTASPTIPVTAWQPLTPRGVAAFARAPLSRLLLVQFLFGVAAAFAIGWFIHRNWFPVIREAAQQMPAQGEIRGGRLQWEGEAPRVLAEGGFLAIVVDPEHSGSVRPATDVLVEFGERDVRVMWLPGCAVWAYPARGSIGFNRSGAVAWWGAWGPPWLWVLAAALAGALMACWAGLAALYCAPVWLLAFLANRRLGLAGSWKLAGAAVLPGALLLSAGVVLYGFGVLDLVHLAAAFVAHIVLGWFYLLASPWFVQKLPAVPAAARNPFHPPAGET
jgi:hypothetical protein